MHYCESKYIRKSGPFYLPLSLEEYKCTIALGQPNPYFTSVIDRLNAFHKVKSRPLPWGKMDLTYLTWLCNLGDAVKPKTNNSYY